MDKKEIIKYFFVFAIFTTVLFLILWKPTKHTVCTKCSTSCPTGACPSGQLCRDGECITPECECSPTCPTGACPSGQLCRDGECITPECECSPTCPNGTCPSGQLCRDGKCIEPPSCKCSELCPNGTCPTGHICRDYICQVPLCECSPECLNGTCSSGHLCQNGQCVQTANCSFPENPVNGSIPDPILSPPPYSVPYMYDTLQEAQLNCNKSDNCTGITYLNDGTEYTLRSGTGVSPGDGQSWPKTCLCTCSPTCPNGTCPSGQLCRTGQCITPPCTCSPTCPNGTCPSGQLCRTGQCITPPCTCSPTCPNGTCPSGQLCQNGQCTHTVNCSFPKNYFIGSIPNPILSPPPYSVPYMYDTLQEAKQDCLKSDKCTGITYLNDGTEYTLRSGTGVSPGDGQSWPKTCS
jgi:hypothetical protein